MICLVYDVSNKDSFGHLKFWYDKCKDVFANNKKTMGRWERDIYKPILKIRDLCFVKLKSNF